MKSTSSVLAEYGHLEDIPLDAEAWTVKVRGAKRLVQELEAAMDDAELYRTLATLRDDVPLQGSGGKPLRLADLEWSGTDESALMKVASEVDDPGIVERMARAR